MCSDFNSSGNCDGVRDLSIGGGDLPPVVISKLSPIFASVTLTEFLFSCMEPSTYELSNTKTIGIADFVYF